MQCWYCGCDIPYELIEKIKVNQNNVCCETCCAIISRKGNSIGEKRFEKGIDLKATHRQWIFILYRQVYGLLRKSRYTNMIREKKELKPSQINRLAKKLRMTSLEQDIPNIWLDNPNINRKDFMDYHEYRQNQLCLDEIFEASFLPLFQNAIKFVYDSIIGNQKIANFHGKVQMEIIEDLMKYYGVSINYYERGTFLYYITMFISRYIYNLIKKSNQNPQQKEDKIEEFVKAVLLEVSFKDVNNELLSLIVSNNRKRFKSKYEMFQSDLIWNQIYRESFLTYVRWLTDIILELMNNNIDFSNLQGIKQDLAENLSRRNLFGKNTRLPSEFRVNFIIVLSRMIYTIVVTQANKMNIKLHQMELKINAINEIVELLIKGIITNNQISSNYLVELYAIQPKEFDYTYQVLRSELKSDTIFAINFKNYLLWLTKIVYGLVTSEFDKKTISQFEYTLINDLRKFSKKREKYKLSSEDTKDDSNNINHGRDNVDPSDNKLLTEEDQKLTLFNYLEKLLLDYPNDLEVIIRTKRSVKSFVREFHHSDIRKVRKWFLEYLTYKFGTLKAGKRVYESIWKHPWTGYTQKKQELSDILNREMKKYKRTKNIDDVTSATQLSEKFGVTTSTVIRWIKEYLQINENDNADDLYFEIWEKKPIEYEKIENYINERGGTLLTSEEQYNNMEEASSWRFVEIRDHKGHVWSGRVNHLLYDESWCPFCLESKSKKMMHYYMEEIFTILCGKKIKFDSEVYLYKVYGISKEDGGWLRFDGYNGQIKITIDKKVYTLKIAFEYDGRQHDEYVEGAYHNNLKEFEKQQADDLLKNKQAKNHNTMLIRLKGILGYNYKNHHKFPSEIIRQVEKQLEELTGTKIKIRDKIDINEMINNAKLINGND